MAYDFLRTTSHYGITAWEREESPSDSPPRPASPRQELISLPSLEEIESETLKNRDPQVVTSKGVSKRVMTCESPFPIRVVEPKIEQSNPTNREKDISMETTPDTQPKEMMQAVTNAINSSTLLKEHNQTVAQLRELKAEAAWKTVCDATRAAIMKCRAETPLSTSESLKDEHRILNRYNGPHDHPFNHSLVKAPSPFFPNGVYINANAIEVSGLKFIATQGPLPHTVMDFKRMVASSEAQVIATMVMVNENGREKCFRYWPEEERLIVEESAKDPVDGIAPLKQSIVMRDILVFDAEGNERTVQQIHYKNWPDRGIPDLELYRQFLKLIEEHSEGKPVVTHCSAGFGRTGSVIAGLAVREQIREAQAKGEAKEAITLNIPETIAKIRLQRNPGMVQTKEQLEFVVKHAISELEG